MSDKENQTIGRRDALKAGLATAAAALVPSTVAERAVAQSTDPRLQLGGNWAIDDDADGEGNDDLRIEHQPTGAGLRYDVSAGAWVPSTTLDMSNNDVTNVADLDVGTVSTDDATINNLVTIDSSEYLDHIQRIDNNGSDVSIDTSTLSTGTSEPQSFIVDLYLTTGGNTTGLQLRFNGDSDGTGYYEYTDRSGTQTTGADEIKITQPTRGFDTVLTRIKVGQAFNQVVKFDTNVRRDQQSAADYGRRTPTAEVESIDIIIDGDAEQLTGHAYRRRLD